MLKFNSNYVEIENTEEQLSKLITDVEKRVPNLKGLILTDINLPKVSLQPNSLNDTVSYLDKLPVEVTLTAVKEDGELQSFFRTFEGYMNVIKKVPDVKEAVVFAPYNDSKYREDNKELNNFVDHLINDVLRQTKEYLLISNSEKITKYKFSELYNNNKELTKYLKFPKDHLETLKSELNYLKTINYTPELNLGELFTDSMFLKFGWSHLDEEDIYLNFKRTDLNVSYVLTPSSIYLVDENGTWKTIFDNNVFDKEHLKAEALRKELPELLPIILKVLNKKYPFSWKFKGSDSILKKWNTYIN